MTIHWKCVERFFGMVQFYPVCNFGFGTVRSEKVINKYLYTLYLPAIQSLSLETCKNITALCQNFQ